MNFISLILFDVVERGTTLRIYLSRIGIDIIRILNFNVWGGIVSGLRMSLNQNGYFKSNQRKKKVCNQIAVLKITPIQLYQSIYAIIYHIPVSLPIK